MCFSKKCDYSGAGINLGGQTFAEICPDCKLKNSYVKFDKFFRSLTVEKPYYYNLSGVDHLITNGTGILNLHGSELQGVYTLIMSDATTQPDRYFFEFITFDPANCSISVQISCLAEIRVTKCSNSWFKKKSKNTQINEQENTLKETMNTYRGCYAKKIMYYPNGRVEEYDLIG